MASGLRRRLLHLLSWLMPDFLSRWLARRLSRALQTQLGGKITDGFLDLLLRGLDLAFCLSRRFRRNLTGFEGRYVFETANGRVSASALFHNGDMRVVDHAVGEWDVKITFDDEPALWAFLLQGQGVLDTILGDKVAIEGNLNYVYKFGFMASDLARILGVA